VSTISAKAYYAISYDGMAYVGIGHSNENGGGNGGFFPISVPGPADGSRSGEPV